MVATAGAGLATGFETVGAVLSVGLNAPQAWRSCRHRLVSGLSPAARWLAVVQSVSWATFGLLGGGRTQVVTNVVCGLLHTSVLVALLVLAPASRRRRVVGPQAAAAAAWLLLLAWAARTGSVPVGSLAALCGTAALVPQLVHLARTRGADCSGISPATTWLALVSASCWSAYGLLASLSAVWLPSLLSVGAYGSTLVLVQRSRPCDAGPAVLVLPRPRAALDDAAVGRVAA